MASKILNPGPSSLYERMSGGCTRIVAAEMISSVSPPIDSSSYILDNACGPGIITEQVKLLHPDAKIMATDLAPKMIEDFKQQAKFQGWIDTQTEIQDIRELSKLTDGTFTHVFMNLGLPIPTDPEGNVKAVAEVYRVLKLGGVAMLSTWADRVWLTAFYNTARTIRPGVPPQTSMRLEPELMHAAWLATQLQQGGFGTDIEVRQCLTSTSAGSLDEMVENMMMAQGMFFAGYNDEELGRAKIVLKEELQKLRTFEKFEGGVRIRMKAWIGVGWKRGDGGEEPV